MNLFLRAISSIYGMVVGMRNKAYDLGVFKTHRIPIPVISIGNITAGGSGKTPIVEYIVEFLLQQNVKCAVVSRGYKRQTKGTIVVSDGMSAVVAASQGGDEPVQIAQRFSKAIVIADENRVRGCTFAVNELGAELIVLDDAFQHRRCYRDLNIVVYDTTTPPYLHTLLPAGRLREPLHNLSRADMVLLTRCISDSQGHKIQQDLRLYNDAPFAATRFIPINIRAFEPDGLLPLEAVKEKPLVAFSGIGSPDSFEQTLQELGVRFAHHERFGDHRIFTDGDIKGLIGLVKKHNAEGLITTEKDRVRLEGLPNLFSDMNVYSVQMGVEFLFGKNELETSILSLLTKEKA